MGEARSSEVDGSCADIGCTARRNSSDDTEHNIVREVSESNEWQALRSVKEDQPSSFVTHASWTNSTAPSVILF